MEAVKRYVPNNERPSEQDGAKGPVLLVGNFLSATLGNYSICEDLAGRLAASGWTVLTTSNKPGRVPRLIDMTSTVWRHRREYNLAQVDVYSGLAFSWAEAVCWMLRRAGKPYVLTLRGGNLPNFARRWPARVKHLFRSAATITAPSRYLFEQMSTYRSDMRLLPNPLDINQYSFRLRERPRAQMIWLRAFNEIYNPALAPRVVARLVQEFPNAHLTMIGHDKGDGSFQRTQDVAKEIGVDNRVHMTGGVPKSTVRNWLQKGDIFLNTTNVDNTPISIMEAMACGLCIVSTNVGGLPYLLEDEHDALLVPPDDPKAMARAVRRILNEDGLAERLSRNGREKVEQFDWAVVLPQCEALLANVAKGHR